MVKLALISPMQRKDLLEEQVLEIIWSTFLWTEGEYSFAPKRVDRDDLVKLAVRPGDLIGRSFPLEEFLPVADSRWPEAYGRFRALLGEAPPLVADSTAKRIATPSALVPR